MQDHTKILLPLVDPLRKKRPLNDIPDLDYLSQAHV